MIRIISDSTCDLSAELQARCGVTILPLNIVLGDATYRDGVDITPDEIYAWADAHQTTPKTAACSTDAARKAFRPLIENGDELLVFTISASMSGSHNAMRLAADMLEGGERIHLIDSANLSTGVGLLVMAAADMVAQGLPAGEIVRRVEELKPLVRASFVVDTLTYLHRGGRCSGVAAFMGSALKLHPRIRVTGGAMSADKKYRGAMDRVLMKYVADLEAELRTARPERVFITHSGVSESTIRSVEDYLRGLGRFGEILVTRAGGVISSHCGPGTLGVLFIAGQE